MVFGNDAKAKEVQMIACSGDFIQYNQRYMCNRHTFISCERHENYIHTQFGLSQMDSNDLTTAVAI